MPPPLRPAQRRSPPCRGGRAELGLHGLNVGSCCYASAVSDLFCGDGGQYFDVTVQHFDGRVPKGMAPGLANYGSAATVGTSACIRAHVARGRAVRYVFLRHPQTDEWYRNTKPFDPTTNACNAFIHAAGGLVPSGAGLGGHCWR